MPTTEVILAENIKGLGAEADVVKVKRGYARNFLIPTGQAFEMTPTSLRKINHLKKKRAEREAKELAQAEEVATKLRKLKLTLTLETGTQGKAFGSVTAKDIESAISRELPDVTLERHAIQLERGIKETGTHIVPVRVHPDVVADLKIKVESATKTEPSEEAEAQEE